MGGGQSVVENPLRVVYWSAMFTPSRCSRALRARRVLYQTVERIGKADQAVRKGAGRTDGGNQRTTSCRSGFGREWRAHAPGFSSRHGEVFHPAEKARTTERGRRRHDRSVIGNRVCITSRRPLDRIAGILALPAI